MFGSEQTIYIYRIDSVNFLCRNLLEHRGSPEIKFMQVITSSMPPFTRSRMDVTMSLP